MRGEGTKGFTLFDAPCQKSELRLGRAKPFVFFVRSGLGHGNFMTIMFEKSSSKLTALASLAALATFTFISSGGAEDLAPLPLKLPAPAFIGTPSDTPVPANVEKPTGKPRAPFMAPAGVSNVALGKPVTSSATNALPEKLAKLTDGMKEASEQNVVLLRKGVQWVQIDLQSPQEIYAIIVWHAFDAPKVYHGVVAQVADDADFTKNVRTLFNNDRDNGDGLGAGTNREYFESNEGKLIEGNGTVARYVRLYSRGSTETRLNEYTEIEVWGRPAK